MFPILTTFIIVKQEEEERKKRSYTSFGKLILATEKSKPAFSMGKAARFPKLKIESNGYYSYLYSYSYRGLFTDKFKYKKSPEWSIIGRHSPPCFFREEYIYYNDRYNPQNDFSTLPKKWDNPVEGSIGPATRIKYNFTEHTPGPGRYETNYKITKLKTPSYYVGEKVVIDINKNFYPGPGQYYIRDADKTLSKWKNMPTYQFGTSSRRKLKNPKWTKNETFYIYSSMGNQIMTKKRTEARPKEGKSTRTIEQKRGVFKSMMERQHIPVRIPMLDF